MRTIGMGSHHSSHMQRDEWLTPPWILDRLPEFDLDPCASVERPWDTAKHHYTIEDNGLNQEWFGKVFCNPPYGIYAKPWLRKCAEHNNSIALTFARTETKTFFKRVWGVADAVLFIEGRLFFYDVKGNRAKGNGGAPSILIAYGSDNAKILKECGINGVFVENHEIVGSRKKVSRIKRGNAL